MITRVAWSLLRRSSVPIAALALLGACGSPIEGEWRSDVKLPVGQRNTISFDGDLVGRATIYATTAADVNDWWTFKYDTDAYENEDGYSWLVKMDCKSVDHAGTSGGCGNEDFKMECEVIDTGKDDELEKMNCKGKGKWESYPFDFERVE